MKLFTFYAVYKATTKRRQFKSDGTVTDSDVNGGTFQISNYDDDSDSLLVKLIENDKEKDSFLATPIANSSLLYSLYSFNQTPPLYRGIMSVIQSSKNIVQKFQIVNTYRTSSSDDTLTTDTSNAW